MYIRKNNYGQLGPYVGKTNRGDAPTVSPNKQTKQADVVLLLSWGCDKKRVSKNHPVDYSPVSNVCIQVQEMQFCQESLKLLKTVVVNGVNNSRANNI